MYLFKNEEKETKANVVLSDNVLYKVQQEAFNAGISSDTFIEHLVIQGLRRQAS